MQLLGVLPFLLGAVGSAAAGQVPRDTTPPAMTIATVATVAIAPVDTPRARPRVVEVSDWYERRLTLHRRISYAILPVFAFQFAAGEQLYDKSSSAPAWARNGHRAGATTLAVLFTANTITGVWNLWEGREQPGNGLRLAHGLSMLAADAGFTYAGAVLSEQAERDPRKRSQHRTVALTSMGVSTVSGILMKLLNK